LGSLDGRVAIVTGAGRGIGREHALLLAAEGARVVVNDLGVDVGGSQPTEQPAQQVVREILADGGQAVANHDDITQMDGATRLIAQAVTTYGDLHVLVNNAGILRDRMFAKMTADDWDAVMTVHLRGHFAPSRAAVDYWRSQAKSQRVVKASMINTTSVSGIFGNVGQANYGAAKAGIATMTVILAEELGRYGIRCNAVAPSARTRMSEGLPLVQAPTGGGFDIYHPANNSPLIAALAAEDCPVTGQVYLVVGGKVSLMKGWSTETSVEKDRRWTVDEMAEALLQLRTVPGPSERMVAEQ
jgi:NAD(P)-dependent dehydrogenase (short-subunit alcohol dehydrogenase family)